MMRAPNKTMTMIFFFKAVCTSHIMTMGKTQRTTSVRIFMTPLYVNMGCRLGHCRALTASHGSGSGHWNIVAKTPEMIHVMVTPPRARFALWRRPRLLICLMRRQTEILDDYYITWTRYDCTFDSQLYIRSWALLCCAICRAICRAIGLEPFLNGGYIAEILLEESGLIGIEALDARVHVILNTSCGQKAGACRI